MKTAGWWRYAWPGLPQLMQGNWWGLGWALVGAVFLNLAILSTFLWKEWLPAGVKIALWGGIILLWSGAAISTTLGNRLQSALPSPLPNSTNTLFVEATEFYLQGQWFEAEKRLIQLLRQNPRDVEARLMIATLFRHTRRWEEALRQLDQLERLEASQGWALEIQRERALIQQAKAQNSSPDSTASPLAA
ncbi:MAG: hypothetical protein NZ602_09520 [Thermoguttaceae bacterium]|nr:hypothetical protein [Thermoguttaceae bacterium]MDW8039062.1 hypothetical protein [Thermoguttaceae bacterium]